MGGGNYIGRSSVIFPPREMLLQLGNQGLRVGKHAATIERQICTYFQPEDLKEGDFLMYVAVNRNKSIIFK
jgi:hypothetical protein